MQTLAPRLHAHLITSQTSLSWTEVLLDLKALNCLQASMPRVGPLCANALRIADDLALGQVESRVARFNVLKTNSVKLFFTEVFEKFGTIKAEMKEAHSVIKAKSLDMGFFLTGGKYLLDRPDTDLESETNRLVSIYEDLKLSLQCLFFHLRPSFQAENSKEIDDILEEQFYMQVLNPLKTRLSAYESSPALYRLYERNYGVSLMSRPRSLISQVWGSNYNKETIYCGELVEGLRQGYGKVTYSTGDCYEGCWDSDKYSGKGVYVWKDRGSYEGDFEAGKMQGHGKRCYPSGAVYTGDFQDGRKHGSGTMVFGNGDEYVGTWAEDCMHGLGTYTWTSGGVYTGNFVRDRREGKGKLVLGPEEVHEGEWAAGKLVRRS